MPRPQIQTEGFPGTRANGSCGHTLFVSHERAHTHIHTHILYIQIRDIESTQAKVPQSLFYLSNMKTRNNNLDSVHVLNSPFLMLNL